MAELLYKVCHMMLQSSGHHLPIVAGLICMKLVPFCILRKVLECFLLLG